jgi:hypothetical protein
MGQLAELTRSWSPMVVRRSARRSDVLDVTGWSAGRCIHAKGGLQLEARAPSVTGATTADGHFGGLP